MARAELKALQGHQSIAEFGVSALTKVANDLNTANETGKGTEQAMFAAIVALCSIRLLELENSHAANAERIAQLEGFLKQADSRIAIPNLQV